MDPFKPLFNGSKEVEPSKKFIKAAKQRLFNRIQAQAEDLFVSHYFESTLPEPSVAFVRQAKVRLMSKIQEDRKMASWRLAFGWFKRVTASVLVMVIAATAMLLSIDTGHLVEASQSNEFQLVQGEVYVKSAHEVIGTTLSDEGAFIDQQTFEMRVGDHFRTSENSRVILNFAGGTRVVLDEKTSLLVEEVMPSSGYIKENLPQENTIQLTLTEGQLWVQALNIEEIAMQISTPKGQVSAVKASFNVSVLPNHETQVQVFKNKAQLNFPDFVLAEKTLFANQKILIGSNSESSVPVLPLSEEEKLSEWVQANQKRDYDHLKVLSEKNIENLLKFVGPLPNDFSYSIKRAKENLKDLFGEADNEELVKRANIRLNEAIAILLGKEASQDQLSEAERNEVLRLLNEFRSITQELAEKAQASGTQDEVAQKLLLPSRIVVAAVETSSLSADLVEIKEALNETEALLAENSHSPLQIQTFHLKNDLEKLRDVEKFIGLGKFEEAQKLLGEHQLSQTEESLISNEKEEFSEETLELKKEELALIETIQHQLKNQTFPRAELLTMVDQAQAVTASSLEEALKITEPEIVPPPTLVFKPIDPEIEKIATSIGVYQSFTAKMATAENSLILEKKENDPQFIKELIRELERKNPQTMDIRLINVLKLKVSLLENPQAENQEVEEDESVTDPAQEETTDQTQTPENVEQPVPASAEDSEVLSNEQTIIPETEVSDQDASPSVPVQEGVDETEPLNSSL